MRRQPKTSAPSLAERRSMRNVADRSPRDMRDDGWSGAARFACGQFQIPARHEPLGTVEDTVDGVVEYRGDVAVALHVVKKGWTAAALRRQLIAGARADARSTCILAAAIGSRVLGGS